MENYEKRDEKREAAEKVTQKIVNWKIFFLIRYFFIIQIKKTKFEDISIHYFVVLILLT